MINASMQGSIRSAAESELLRASTANVRVEFLRCRTEARVQWRTTQPEVSLMWVRDKGSDARLTVTGRESDRLTPGRARFWFFPEGVGAEGEVAGRGAYDCAGVFVDPAFLSPVAKQALAEPIAGFSHESLGRAFDDLFKELAEPDDILPLLTEGLAMQALAYVARASRLVKPRLPSIGGLAPWQLRKAKDLLSADLSQNVALDSVAAVCRLSVSHFSRAFKASVGTSPHQWLINTRIERARELLQHSATPLVDVAGICGFADQSHFSRVFVRVAGKSPGAWRREHRA